MAPRSFLPVPLPRGGELGDRAARRRLRRLAAGVGVHLGVEHEDVDVAARRQHVVEAAEADVVGPAVAADDPDALAHEVVGEREQVARVGVVGAVDARRARRAARRRARAARAISGSVVLVGVEDRRRRGRRRARAPGARASSRGLRRVCASSAEAHAEAELGVVLEQRVVPGRPAARRRSSSTAWSAGCRRRSTSSRWRWRRSCGRRTAGVTSLTYGVSPQPAQAPENSNSGSQHLRALDRVVRQRGRGRARGIDRKKSQLRARASRWAAAGSMLIALWRPRSCSSPGRRRRTRRSRCSRRARPGSSADGPAASLRPERPWTGTPSGAPASAAGSEHLHADRRVRADDRALAAVDADARDPRSGSPGRSRASRTSPCRSGTCRRPGAR